MTTPFHRWGVTEEETRMEYPCDRSLPAPDLEAFRGVTVNAPPDVVFRWLCQLRQAPYSYDWIDNFGRRSPRALTPGLDELEIGQTFMTMFELETFDRPRHLTLRIPENAREASFFGRTWVSYLVVPLENGRCRLLVKINVVYPANFMKWLVRLLLPPGDLVMMRKQLLNLKALAEQTTHTRARALDPPDADAS